MSLGYFLVKLVLKIKGEKRSWSQDPIDYQYKRKQDEHNPSKKFLVGCSFETNEIGLCKVTSITPKTMFTDVLLLYCHGGAFVYGPTKENWIALSKLAKRTGSKAWMIDYPKAPESNIEQITENVYQVYLKAIKIYDPSKVILIGDSAGGSLILTLAQRLSKENRQQPNCLIAITPVVDASVSNDKIPEIDLIDPILSIKGVLSANKMCVGDLSLKDPLISPLYGGLKGLPPIHLFMATNDILTPDQEKMVEEVRSVNGEINVIVGKGLPHVWPILPIMPEAKQGLDKIVSIVKEAAL
ncbi:alpha/beta hydrolase [Aquimarina sp. AU474]|uniref:alpha/beta hydrolase n=1 Tax=Aquimarina sp. AU474 TaxID=2108529 RepID=UPI000D686996|nr:alpha/beta hydrolase [Aquimarina sp. AU474]